ncbi:MAG: right-handed parallel beta-helix repeat-containing protein [Planctomycetota bacterium]|jgi:predicted outer membrane repeat protein
MPGADPSTKGPLTTGIAALFLATAVQAGTVLCVDDDAPAGGDGLSWPTACRSLQDALAAAAASGGAVNQIHVAQGTYLPDHDASSPEGAGDCFLVGEGCPDPVCAAAVCAVLPTCCDIAWDDACVTLALDLCTEAMAATFQLIDGVELQGGYAGIGEPNPAARDIELYPSILSGDLAGDDRPAFVNNDENSLHVVTVSGTDATAALDGFTIKAGHARGASWPSFDSSGAGILNDAGSPIVANCMVTGNFAQEYAGGMENANGASPTVSSCEFTGNAAGLGGAGMDNNFDSSPTIIGCTFSGNAVDEPTYGSGGGMLNESNSNPQVTNCTFTLNSARQGGGLMSWYSSSPLITDSTFDGNTGEIGGGILDFSHCSPTITGCVFTANVTTDVGGAMFNDQFSDPTIGSCQFVGNSSNYGGAVYNQDDSSPTIENCEFTGNTAGWGGAIYTHTRSNATILSCTFDGNASTGTGGVSGNGGAVFSNDSNPTVTACTFTENTAGNLGGAMMNLWYSETVVTNCRFIGNQAGGRGGAARSGTEASPTFANCTFSGNSAVESGGALSAGSGQSDASGNTLLVNCVLWDNTAPAGSQLSLSGNFPAELTVAFSDVEGGEAEVLVEPGFVLNWGAGNLDADPLFEDPVAGDLHITSGSPVIDAGDNTAVPVGITTDFDGNPRFVDDPCREDTGLGDPPIVDMGAYEFQGRSCDLDGSGAVGVTDFLALLAAWGPCPDPCPPSCPADFDGDCTVGVTDFLLLLAQWG